MSKIGYIGSKQHILSCNFPTANNAPEIFTQDLKKQITYNRVTQLIRNPAAFISSPFWLEPKPNRSWRRIYHLLHPRSSFVYYHIPQEHKALEYISIDDAILVLRILSKNTTMVKRNLSDIFYYIPVAHVN